MATEDLYALLGVSPSASTRQIQQAYHAASLSFHPDRVSSDEDRTRAADIFVKLKNAHDNQRCIYDALGIDRATKGLAVVAARCKTPAELLREYELEEERKLERAFASSLNEKGELIVSTDVSDVITSSGELRLANAAISNISLRHSTDFVLPASIRAYDDTRIRLGYAAHVRDNLTGTAVLLPSLSVSKDAYTYSVNGRLSASGERPGIELESINSEYRVGIKIGTPGYVKLSSYQHPLFRNKRFALTGQCSLFLSANPHLNYTLTASSSQSYSPFASASFQLRPHVFTMLSIGAGVRSAQTTFFASTLFASDGIGVRVRAEQMRGTHSSVSAEIDLSNRNVSLTLGITRGSLSYVFPFTLSPEPTAPSLLYAVVFAGLAYFASKRILPTDQTLQSSCNQSSQKSKTDAQLEQALMMPAYRRAVQKERSDKTYGIVIRSATYGNEFDVTVPVQLLVTSSGTGVKRVKLPAFYRKDHLCGFFDPSPGSNKLLIVEYERQQRIHKIQALDSEEIQIPFCYPREGRPLKNAIKTTFFDSSFFTRNSFWEIEMTLGDEHNLAFIGKYVGAKAQLIE